MKAKYCKDGESITECFLCPNFCRIVDGKRGICRGRGREDGRMVLHNFGVVVASHLDPIEKKPLYHFFPGSAILSVGTFGCNLSCRFCQNCDISQRIVEGTFISPDSLAAQACGISENLGVAFTYNEPGIWFEYVMESAVHLRKADKKVVLVTNGYLEKAPWQELCSVAHAMNIDLKGFTGDFYKKICGGKLEPVMENIKIAFKAGVHIELTNLVVPGLNTDVETFERMVDWIAGISPKIPFHLSRYFPNFHENQPPTNPEILEDFFQRAKDRLHYVYLGNFSARDGNDTKCPKCGEVWVRRQGYSTRIISRSGKCSCGDNVDLIR